MSKVDETQNAELIFNFFHKSVQTCSELSKSFKFDKTHIWHLSLVVLYGSILELSHSIIVIANSGMPIGIPILLRSQFEAFSDLQNLSKDRRYGYRMEATRLHEWIKIFKEAKKEYNPYLISISNLPEIDKALDDYQTQLEKLESEGYLPLSNFNKFEKSDLVPEYRSVYNFLCCDSHNNLRSLFHRFTQISEDQNDFSVNFFEPFNTRSHFQYIDSSAGILLESTKIIHTTLDSTKSAEVDSLIAELNKLREPFRA